MCRWSALSTIFAAGWQPSRPPLIFGRKFLRHSERTGHEQDEAQDCTGHGQERINSQPPIEAKANDDRYSERDSERRNSRGPRNANREQ